MSALSFREWIDRILAALIVIVGTYVGTVLKELSVQVVQLNTNIGIMTERVASQAANLERHENELKSHDSRIRELEKRR